MIHERVCPHEVDHVIEHLLFQAVPRRAKLVLVIGVVQLPHVRAHVIEAAEQHIDDEIQFEDEPLVLQLRQLGLEAVAGLRPVAGNLRQRQFRVRQGNATGIDLVENIDGLANAGLYWNSLFRELALLD
jgi:tetrahydromethanopterin S-methyltransferase subunit A